MAEWKDTDLEGPRDRLSDANVIRRKSPLSADIALANKTTINKKMEIKEIKRGKTNIRGFPAPSWKTNPAHNAIKVSSKVGL